MLHVDMLDFACKGQKYATIVFILLIIEIYTDNYVNNECDSSFT